jgi:hypothetical protein
MAAWLARQAGFQPLVKWGVAEERTRITLAACALTTLLLLHAVVGALWGASHPLLLRWCVYAVAMCAFHGLEFAWSAR